MEILHSKKNMASFGFGKFINEFLNMAFGTLVFFYYESELGLDVWLTAFGYIIFAIWNAFNDPLIGYLTDRPFKFTKKWGRRFPWVLIGGVPWIISYILLFTPPDVDPNEGAWILVAWLVFSTCLYDTFASLFNVSFYGLFPDKFRIDKERRDAAGISTFVGTFGVALGAILPPLFIVFGDRSSYALQSGVVVIVCLIALVLAIPGSREDQYRIDSYLEKCEEGFEKEPFISTLKSCLKQKNFLAYLCQWIFYRVLIVMMIGSIPYLVRFVLEMEASAVTLIMAGFLIGAIISIPLWTKIAHKTDNDRKTFIIAAFFMSVLLVPLIFIVNYYLIVIFVAIWGVSLGGYWLMQDPVLSEIIDESVILTGRREEGIINGIVNFFGRLALVIQAVCFALVHTLTGFIEGAEIQSATAKWGIQIHFALIPMIFMLIGTIILWKWYDLTPEKVRINKEKLAEIGL